MTDVTEELDQVAEPIDEIDEIEVAGPVKAAFPRRRTVALVVVALVVVGGLGVTVVLPRLFGPPLVGTEFAEPAPAPSLEGLLTASGKPAAMSDYAGKVVILYFGYLSCPDVCPVTLATVARAVKALGDDADRVQLLMVSVDPARDSPDAVERYVHKFDRSFEALHGVEPELGRVASRWGIFYEFDPPETDGTYSVTHTATLTGVDPDGNLRVLWSFGITADQLAADLRALL